MIRFACTGCDARFTVDDDKAGQVGACPDCAARFVIPPADGGPPPEPEPPELAPGAPVRCRPCPACGATAAVRAADLGHPVACPGCAYEYRAVAVDPDVAPPSRGRRDRGWGDDEPRPRRRSFYPRRDAKPGNVAAVGALLLAGGVYALLHCVGTLVASVGACFLCLVWPPWYMMLVWSILAITRGSQYLGDGAGDVAPPRTLQIVQVLCILNFDAVNLVLGIVGLTLAGKPEVRAYFARRGGSAADED